MDSKKIYKILYFLDYGETFGGAGNTLLQQAIIMKRAGNQVIVVFSDYTDKGLSCEYNRIYSKFCMETIIATYQISSQPEDIDIICLNENYENLKNTIQKIKPDILHSVQINPLVELISRELMIPHIMSIYPLLPDFFSINYLNIFPHYHICDSWYWARRWNQYLKTDYTCIRTAADGKTGIIRNHDSSKTIRYICVGSLYYDKNQMSVIMAFHRALQSGIKGELFIYGYDTDEYAQKCRQYIRDNNLSEAVVIKGFSTDMDSIYKKSDVLICGSTRESYPNVISEAMAYGLIIISTPVAGVPEIIQDGVNGYLTEEYTAEKIADKILEFDRTWKNGGLETIHKNACDTFEKHHSYRAVEEELTKYYNHVIQDNRKWADTNIYDVRTTFSEWIYIYQKNYDSFTDPKKVASKIWYLYHVKAQIKAGIKYRKKFYIWGTGKYGHVVKEIVEVFFPEIHISGFLDSKRSGNFFEYKIYEPEGIIKKESIIILIAAVNGQREIIQCLEENKFQFNHDYFILSARLW